MKIFVLGNPYTKTSPEYLHEGFTTKVWNFCKMFAYIGHEVIHLGVEGSCPDCSDNIPIVSSEVFEKYIGFDGHKPPVHALTEAEKAKQEKERAVYTDIYVTNIRKILLDRCNTPYSSVVCVTWGGIQWGGIQWGAVSKIEQFVVEAGIGYYPLQKTRFRVFESNAWAHLIYGKEGSTAGGYWDEAVIPNVTDPNRFTFNKDKQDFFLLMGRMNEDKGIKIAADISAKLGKTLILAGTPGVASEEAAKRKHVKFMPNVSEDKRKELMSNAKALFAPTWYPEPFGQVVIEAQVSGTPVICTDWGAFPELVLHGVTGYRCRTMDQFYRAATNIDKIDTQKCRDWAVNNFSLEVVAPLWGSYFDTLANLNKKDGWYSYSGKTDTGWLSRRYV